jgi:O-methyltransferase
MSITSTAMTPALHAYMLEHGVREPAAMKRLRARANALPERDMMSGPEVANLVAMQAAIIGARSVIEVGVFVGYTTLALALALPAEGRIVACDVNKTFTEFGRAAWAEAGVADRIDLRLAPAIETLDKLLAQGKAGTVDLVFIDADKGNYLNYYERAMTLLRVGGLVLIDNVFWTGQVTDLDDQRVETKAIRALNVRVQSDTRVQMAMLAVGDGVTMARKVA